ncbi:MAG: DNA mismatch repair protein MutS [Firmicutes bacterium]|nr:DNA mismatch repair protein MutS [Bacillota bacterium]
MTKLSPMMQQYRDTKDKYPDCLLFFRVGDFFELFFDDAVQAAKELNIALTSRDGNKEDGIPMAGVPHHAMENYLSRLVKRGYKIAICDQVEDPKAAKGLVRREVTRVITPGTIIEDNFLDPTRNNWLLALCREGRNWGVAYADISTGEFFCSELEAPREQIEAIISALAPGEILVPPELSRQFCGPFVTTAAEAGADPDFAPKDNPVWLHPLARRATTMILAYLGDKHRLSARHFNTLSWRDFNRYLYLDAVSQRNLELVSALSGDRSGPSLLKVLDATSTAMGGRLLRQMLITPLADAQGINERLDAVEVLTDNFLVRKKLQRLLADMYDLERIVTKVSYNTANARDLNALKTSLDALPGLSELLQDMELPTLLQAARDRLTGFETLSGLIGKALQPDPPLTIREGNIIRSGYSEELDALRALASDGSEWLKRYEQKLKEETTIKSLKLGFNKVFGYYIEVTRANLNAIPDFFIRKQTLVNAERFITPELKEWEEKIISAHERQHSLEYQLFCELREHVATFSARIQATSRAVATIDCFISLAEVAVSNNYCRPQVNSSDCLVITEGRHPVVEKFGEHQFVANDCTLDTGQSQILIITGPNMAGKSTYMRQVALIALMAHVGSFVPAEAARIGVLDGIFTRIGASDDLASGQSTFMVEMSELARILRRATANSLILLDEIGRGTGTTDGLSIARATIEYLHNTPGITAKTLFATHYHQLTALEELERVENCSVQVAESMGEVTFLHKIIAGGSDRSYGIHVAKLAGLPEQLIAAAGQYLETMIAEGSAETPVVRETAATRAPLDPGVQEIIRQLSALDPDDISPRQAWEILAWLQQKAASLPGSGVNYED